MKRALSLLALPATIVVALIAMSSLYVVDVREKALVLRFGEVVQVQETPGLRFKLPVIDDVVKYDARILSLPTEPMEVTPLDDRRLVVDAFARWQITDPVMFRRAVGRGGINEANSRLEGILTNAIRGVLGSVASTAVLSSDRSNLMNRIRDEARSEGNSLGVDVIDVRLTRTDLPEQNLISTYNRMRAERDREAADERARGGEAAQRVRAAADRTVVELTSDARRKAEIIRGEADGQRNAIYADAFGKDPEFFAFSRSLTSYERSLRGENSSIVISPNGRYFDYLRDPGESNVPPGALEAAEAAAATANAEVNATPADGAPVRSESGVVLSPAAEAPEVQVVPSPASEIPQVTVPQTSNTMPGDPVTTPSLPSSDSVAAPAVVEPAPAPAEPAPAPPAN
ncbi:MAG: protease modulator HflC [Paracoccus denitrificans]|nr:MAG: protease modulator HflC [Paracoccus denitrificans]PZO83192.1 MAG: protease modulator HflC [Paracoccus denitrificans]